MDVDVLHQNHLCVWVTMRMRGGWVGDRIPAMISIYPGSLLPSMR